ncbi:UNVERIFIED_CONTAM: Retrovirus-related Pol polyprotein from transposon RE2 [Sesamum latifolium]|uniref:Retrovirus-related Pol polyprotein from transposon RE2 n=1 Tax=Sesamum latifolium TaxID=2727402 RepID=A0AAW2UST8_9LAMI
MKKGKRKAIAATASAEGAPAAPKGKGKGKVGGSQRSKANDVHALSRKGALEEGVSQLLSNPNVCGPLNTPAKRGYSYFITFTDDHSRFDYVYLIRYKSEAFGRFKEHRLQVENETDTKIKTLLSDRGGEYLSGEFIDYLKEDGILSQWIPPGTPQLNGVAERRNQTLLDIVRSMMSFTESLPSFWGYALEMKAKLRNIAPSKMASQMPHEIWHGKPASYKYLRVWGNPAYVKWLVGDKVDSRCSLCRFIGYPKKNCRILLLRSVRAKDLCLKECSVFGKRFSSG